MRVVNKPRQRYEIKENSTVLAPAGYG